MATKRATKRPGPVYGQLFKDVRGGHRFRIKAANGQTISVGESYTRRADARRGLLRVHPGIQIKD